MNTIVLLISILFIQLGSGEWSQLSAEQSALLQEHNEIRRMVSECKLKGQPGSDTPIPDLKWDKELAKRAQELASSCKYHHNNDRLKTSKFERIGQNIAGVWKVNRAVSMWTNEHTNYNFTTNSCQPGEYCGNYTQVVWRENTHVGCGFHDCDDIKTFPAKLFVVCNYGPGGSIGNQRPYTSNSNTCNAGGRDPTYIPLGNKNFLRLMYIMRPGTPEAGYLWDSIQSNRMRYPVTQIQVFARSEK